MWIIVFLWNNFFFKEKFGNWNDVWFVNIDFDVHTPLYIQTDITIKFETAIHYWTTFITKEYNEKDFKKCFQYWCDWCFHFINMEIERFMFPQSIFCICLNESIIGKYVLSIDIPISWLVSSAITCVWDIYFLRMVSFLNVA